MHVVLVRMSVLWRAMREMCLMWERRNGLQFFSVMRRWESSSCRSQAVASLTSA